MAQATSDSITGLIIIISRSGYPGGYFTVPTTYYKVPKFQVLFLVLYSTRIGYYWRVVYSTRSRYCMVLYRVLQSTRNGYYCEGAYSTNNRYCTVLYRVL